MNKVGIITLNGYENYGNRLQNYALQEVITSYDYNVETVIITDKSRVSNKLNEIKSIQFDNLIKKIIFKSTKTLKNISNKKIILKRRIQFKKFSEERIVETKFDVSEKQEAQKLESEFSYFVVGSDQVWNPHYIKGSSINFLSFVSKDKRIAYAPSFGVSSIPEEYKNIYRDALKDFPNISVREEKGAEIIKDLIGVEAKVVLDPTMLLSKEKWLSISKQPVNQPTQPYLLTYFLGSPSERSKIINIAQEKDLKIINLANIKEEEWYIIDPSEFIYLINNAEVFCTDSFHGAVFSILFERPFIVFDREENSYSMNSRIETLLSTFKFQSRLSSRISGNENLFDINFSHVADILNEERSKSLMFLKQSLSKI